MQKTPAEVNPRVIILLTTYCTDFPAQIHQQQKYNYKAAEKFI
jgi:hypothetical protein